VKKALPNVILITVDCLRPDYVSSYSSKIGYKGHIENLYDIDLKVPLIFYAPSPEKHFFEAWRHDRISLYLSSEYRTGEIYINLCCSQR
jgi:hypothetical protein